MSRYPVIEEVVGLPVNPNYFQYLRQKLDGISNRSGAALPR